MRADDKRALRGQQPHIARGIAAPEEVESVENDSRDPWKEASAAAASRARPSLRHDSSAQFRGAWVQRDAAGGRSAPIGGRLNARAVGRVLRQRQIQNDRRSPRGSRRAILRNISRRGPLRSAATCDGVKPRRSQGSNGAGIEVEAFEELAHGRFRVEPNLRRVGAHEGAAENAARKARRIVALERLQRGDRDLRADRRSVAARRHAARAPRAASRRNQSWVVGHAPAGTARRLGGVIEGGPRGGSSPRARRARHRDFRGCLR